MIMFKLATNIQITTNLVKKNIFSLNQSFQILTRNLATTSNEIINPNRNNKPLIINPLKHDDFFHINNLVSLDTLFK